MRHFASAKFWSLYTALPAPGLEAWVPTLLIGLGLLALAFGLVPVGGGLRPAVVPTGGWRR